MLISDVIQSLEGAKGHLKRYPDLMIGYAIGLIELDRDRAARYAALLEKHNVFKGCPSGGEMSEEEYELIRSHYIKVHDGLRAILGYSPRLGNLEDLSKVIDALRLRLPK